MNAWSREDIIIAYALYCVTPLGKINPSNKVIQQVAEIIPHSVASIVMRMRNFQYIDPKVSSGLKNIAKADRMIYEEFKHDWGSLSLEAETLTGLAIFDSSPLQGAKPLSSLTNHGRVSRERHFFKQAVLAAYDDRCFISGCALPQMLVASHIKPYSQCRSEEMCIRDRAQLSGHNCGAAPLLGRRHTAHKRAQTSPFKRRIECCLQDFGVIQSVLELLRQALASGEVDNLDRTVIPSIPEEKNLKIGALGVGIDTALLQRDRAVGLYIDC